MPRPRATTLAILKQFIDCNANADLEEATLAVAARDDFEQAVVVDGGRAKQRVVEVKARDPEAVRPRSGSSAINRLARSARALASFASYADPLLSQTEIVSWGPESHRDLGKAETHER